MTYLLNIGTSHYESLVWLRYYTQDVVFSLESILTLWYLIRKKATYAETFYGFIRSKRSHNEVKPLTKFDVAISLFFETILPHFKSKLEQYLHSKDSPNYKRLQKVFTVLKTIGKLLVFAYQFRYLIDPNFHFFKPYYHLCGYLIRR